MTSIQDEGFSSFCRSNSLLSILLLRKNYGFWHGHEFFFNTLLKLKWIGARLNVEKKINCSVLRKQQIGNDKKFPFFSFWKLLATFFQSQRHTRLLRKEGFQRFMNNFELKFLAFFFCQFPRTNQFHNSNAEHTRAYDIRILSTPYATILSISNNVLNSSKIYWVLRKEYKTTYFCSSKSIAAKNNSNNNKIENKEKKI